jgi:hypothetical protein
MARELTRKIQELRKEKGCTINERVKLVLPASYQTLPKEILANVLRDTLVDTWETGDQISLSTG